jgi:hypothetical protein
VSWGVQQPGACNCAKKYEQWVTCSKSRVVVALCLLPTEKTEFGKKLMISKQNRKQKVL